MSSTRHAEEGAPLRAERWASNPEIERGLRATDVSRRCKALASAQDRELVWALHSLSHEIGLRQLAEELLSDYCDRIGTKEMITIGIESDRTYLAEEVRQIREDGFAEKWEYYFPLKGDSATAHSWMEEGFDADIGRKLREEALLYPESYPSSAFIAKCTEHANVRLARDLTEFCLNPEIKLQGWPWYWADLSETIRAYVRDRIARREAGKVTTELGEKIGAILDFTLRGAELNGRCLTLAIGDGRTGKSFAARQWCEARPGRARYIEIPAGNDDRCFYQSLARGLGLGEFTNYKANEIRIRVESILLSGDLLLCLDQCQRAWPQNNFRPGFPCRIDWIMSMSDQGVPICCLGAEQFNRSLLVVAERSGWDAGQWNERVHYEALPRVLSKEDVANVAREMLPEADSAAIKAATIYACGSGHYLAAIESIAGRARYIASQSGRAEPAAADVREAMKGSVIPSHRNAAAALQKPLATKPGRLSNAPAQVPSLMGETRSPAEPDTTISRGTRGAIAVESRAGRAPMAGSDIAGNNPAITGRNTRPIKDETEAEVIAG